MRQIEGKNSNGMKKYFTRLLCVVFMMPLIITARQDDERRAPLPAIPETASAPAGFAPSGWVVEATVEGDLNGDGRNDAAIVIKSGENRYDERTQRMRFARRALIVALREGNGSLHRSAVSDNAVLDGNEGGVMGDPFQGVTIERGTIVIQHYGGSRDRWSYTHRYRFQSGQWALIGLTEGRMDTLNPSYQDSRDANLSTGLVSANSRGGVNDETRRRIPPRRGMFYELAAMPAERAPVIDGNIAAGEWNNPYAARLNQAADITRGRAQWSGATDLSARLSAVVNGGNLYLRAEVTDDQMTPGDGVRLTGRNGRMITPDETQTDTAAGGYVVESRYALATLARAGLQYPESLDSFMSDDEDFSQPNGLNMEITLEVSDVDGNAAATVMSTRRAGSGYSGSISIYKMETLFLSAR